MSDPLVQTPHYWPKPGKNTDPETTQAIRQAFNGINDHDTAIVNLSGQVTTLQATVKTLTANAATPVVTPTTPTPTAPASTVAPINNQTGVAYSTQNTDSSGLITLDNVAAVAVTLNNAVVVGFYCNIENLGTGLVTLTPLSGTLNNVASLSLAQNQSCWVYFDGTNWWASTGAAASVTSVFGRTGAVVAVSGDYSVGQVTNAMNKTGDTFTGNLTGPGQAVVTKTFLADTGSGSGFIFQGGDELFSPAHGHVELIVAGVTSIDATSSLVTLSGGLAVVSATTATSATSGAGSALPATPALYLVVAVNGTAYKIPLFNV